MELRALTALTQDKDTSFDPGVSNVMLQSNQSPRAPSGSQAGEALPLEQEELEGRMSLLLCCEKQGDKKLLENATCLTTYLIFCTFCTSWLLKYKLFP